MRSLLLLTQMNKPWNCRPQSRSGGGRRTAGMFTTWNTTRVQQTPENRVENSINLRDNSPIPVPSYSLRKVLRTKESHDQKETSE